MALAVQRDGTVQAVDVPPGLGVVSWSYTPPGFPAGLALSLAAAALVAALFFVAPPRARIPAGRSRVLTGPVHTGTLHREYSSGDSFTMNLGGFEFVLATVIAGGSGGAHMTAQHEPTALAQPSTGGSLSPVARPDFTQDGAQTWQVQVLMDHSMPDCAASAAPTIYWLRYTVSGHPGKAQLQGTPRTKR